jgi:hypothetical protein
VDAANHLPDAMILSRAAKSRQRRLCLLAAMFALPIAVALTDEAARAMGLWYGTRSVPSLQALAFYALLLLIAGQAVLRFPCPRCKKRYHGRGNLLAASCEHCGKPLPTRCAS